MDKKGFVVHKDVICTRSSFLKAACECWIKRLEPVELLDDDAQTFNHWLHYVYFNKPPMTNDLHEEDVFRAVVKAYILSDKLGDLRSANIIIDELMRLSDELGKVPCGDLLIHAWTKTPENSLLRLLFIDYIVHESKHDIFAKNVSMIPPDMLIAVINEFGRVEYNIQDGIVRRVYSVYVDKRAKCYYHQHDKSHPQCAE